MHKCMTHSAGCTGSSDQTCMHPADKLSAASNTASVRHAAVPTITSALHSMHYTTLHTTAAHQCRTTAAPHSWQTATLTATAAAADWHQSSLRHRALEPQAQVPYQQLLVLLAARQQQQQAMILLLPRVLLLAAPLQALGAQGALRKQQQLLLPAVQQLQVPLSGWVCWTGSWTAWRPSLLPLLPLPPQRRLWASRRRRRTAPPLLLLLLPLLTLAARC